MAEPLVKDHEETLELGPSPQLSHSRINRYLTCPEQYRLYYVERLRPRIESAGLVFGALVHEALAELFRAGVDPVETFRREWANLERLELRYNKRESWEGFRAKGQNLLAKFLHEEVPKVRQVYGVEKKFTLAVTSLDLPFVGIVDLVADVEGRRTVVDFKTAASDYDEHEAVLSDQLTAYWAAEPDAERVALCVFVKTKEPRIEWHYAKRGPQDLADYLAKARLVANAIAHEEFYKRPGRQCGYCEFLPVCLRDEMEVQATLVKLT